MRPLLFLCLLAFSFGCASSDDSAYRDFGSGTGVVLRPDAVVYSGSPINCSLPATIDFTAVRKATPE